MARKNKTSPIHERPRKPRPNDRSSGSVEKELSEFAAFRSALLLWYDRNKRSLPWRDESDLYRVWLSEIMLQQTQVKQVVPYYQQFVRTFPSLKALAAADLHAVLMAWEGLGYYARVRNLHKAARQVIATGEQPGTRAALQKLPGIGPYTARAIASIVYGEPVAAVDGNVRRVVARLFAVDGTSVAELQKLADSLLDQKRPGDYNQAVMELGARVCTPRKPACSHCPVQSYCLAFTQGTPEKWPVRKKRSPSPHFDVAVGVIWDAQGRLFIQRRPEEALLGGLWELPGGKREPDETVRDACRRELQEELSISVSVGDLIGKVNHAYTHFRITLWAFECHILEGTPVSTQGLATTWVHPGELHDYPFPRANRRILDLMTNSSSN